MLVVFSLIVSMYKYDDDSLLAGKHVVYKKNVGNVFLQQARACVFHSLDHLRRLTPKN
jgi:hypothetical protein